jgi:hypothetical protein
MSYNLFLDDQSNPIQIVNPTLSEKDRERYLKYTWIIAKSYDEFVEIVSREGVPSMVSFDHDLSEEHWHLSHLEENLLKVGDVVILDYDVFEVKTGYHAAEWFLEYCVNKRKRPEVILVHSRNPIGKKNIEGLLF